MKKFLSMVLAMVMTLSLVTVSAGAKEFPDNDQLTDANGVYEEAVNVLSEMGIIDGDTDGNFKPKGTLTRGAASKIIACMMLGKTTAESLGTAAAPFKDVPVGSTFAGYIAYCVEQGIIDGYADGTFRPSGALTGYAFQKMLLTALGYDSAIEGYANNPNWRVNVAGRAQQEGLLKGLDASSYSAAEAATREQACLMALNTIKTPLVEYENKGSTITVNGAAISQSASAAKYVTTVDRSRATAIDDRQYQTAQTGQQASYFVEFGEQYQPDLRRNRTSDDFERPAYTWTWQKDEVGTYVDYSLLQGEYNTGVTGRALRELLGQTAIDNSDIYYFVDGVEYDPDVTKYIDHVKIEGITAKTMVRSNEKDDGMTKNGVLTQVFLDRDHGSPWTLTITSIDTWLAKANADYNKTAEELSLTAYTAKEGSDKTVTKNLKVDVEDVPEIENVKKDDFILIQRSGKDSSSTTNPVLRVVDIADVEILSDSTVTQFSKGDRDGRAIDKLTTGGTEYNFSQKCYYDAEALEDYDRSLLTNMTYDVYLDEYGYVIGVNVHEGNRNYVFIAGYDFRNQSGATIINKTATASAIFLDGSMSNITVNSSDTDENIKVYRNKSNANNSTITNNYYNVWGRDGVAQHNRWYSYTVNAAGVYTLKPVERMLAVDYSGDTTLNSSNLSLLANIGADTPKTTNMSTRSYGNDGSIYITTDVDQIATITGSPYVISEVKGVYTGVQNVKMDVKNRTDFPEVYALYDSDNYIIAAIVIGEAQGSIDNYTYILGDAKSEKYEDGYYYWTFEGVRNGSKETFTARSKFSDTINKLKPYHMQQLLFDGDYVSRVTDITSSNLTSTDDVHGTASKPNEKFYANNTIVMDDVESKVDIYDIGHSPVGDGYNYNLTYAMDTCNTQLVGVNGGTHARIDTTITFTGNTLYLGETGDTGLAVRPNAKAVLIQRFNNDRNVTEHTSVRDAIDSMRDANDNMNGMQFKGRIVAPLKDGVAQWVVIISDTQLRTGDTTGATGGGNQDTPVQSTYSLPIRGLDNAVQVYFQNVAGLNSRGVSASLNAAGDLTLNISAESGYVLNDGNYTVTVDGKDVTNYFTADNTVDGQIRLSSSSLFLKSNELVRITIKNLSVSATATRTVTFDADNGTTNTTRTVTYNTTVTEPVVPTKANYKFDGWYLNGSKFDFSTPITSDITLVAHWIENQTTVTPDNPAKVEGGTIAVEQGIEKVEGIKFTDASIKVENNQPVVTLPLDPDADATVTDVPVYYTVVVNGTAYKLKLAKDAAASTADKLVFTGFEAKDAQDNDVPANVLAEATRQFANNPTVTLGDAVAQVTVTFDLNYTGATGAPAAQTITAGEKVTTPTAPTRDGYTFVGWATTAGATTSDVDFATATFNSNTTLYAVWTTTSIPATAIALNKTTLNLVVDAEETLTATLTPAGSTDTITWESSDKAVATVDQNGKVTAVAAGTATITAKVSDTVKANCAVTVSATSVPATAVALNKTKLSLVVNAEETLTATLTPTGSTDTITWESSDETVATVDQNGKVTAVAAGTATIAAKVSDTVKADCAVTVTAAAPASSEAKVTLGSGAAKETTLTAGVHTFTATAADKLAFAQSGEDGVDGTNSNKPGYWPQIVMPALGDDDLIILSRSYGVAEKTDDQLKTIIDAFNAENPAVGRKSYGSTLADWYEVCNSTAWGTTESPYWPEVARDPDVQIVWAKKDAAADTYTYEKYKFDFSAASIDKSFNLTAIATTETVLNKPVSDLQENIEIAAENTVGTTFKVTGTSKNITTAWTNFNSVVSEQTGHYVALNFAPIAQVTPEVIKIEVASASDGTFKPVYDKESADTASDPGAVNGTLVWKLDTNKTLYLKIYTTARDFVRGTIDCTGVTLAS